MSFTAGDLSHNISKIMQDFVKAERVTLRTVKDISDLHSEILLLQLALGTGVDIIHSWAYDKYTTKLETLRIYCENNRENIVKVFPSLKEPITDFFEENPYDGSIDEDWEAAVDFESEQNEVFVGHIFNALQEL